MVNKKIVRAKPTATLACPAGSLDPVLQQVYQNRGVTSLDELTLDLNTLHPVSQLLNAEKAAQCLAQALIKQQCIVIVGDFDADGATSSALVMQALLSFGHKKIHYLVPNRFDYGYGLTPEIVDVALNYQPDLIITVDNGIASVAGVAKAKAEGITVVVTDHHLPPQTLPIADAIVNPAQIGCPFPSKCLAGVGVAFYVMLALRQQLRKINWFAEQNIPEPAMSPLLDLVALGTVADVVPLDQNNRILVHHGLLRIRQGHTRPGLFALLAIAKRNHQRIVSADLGFAIAPRLNAAGRLEDMSIGIQCLLAETPAQANALAKRLDALNQERKTIEHTMQAQALVALDHLTIDTASLPMGLCLTDPSWHQGVIGILAGRLKERFHRPVIAFASANETELKGSARSISDLHIRDCLNDIATVHPDLILKFGGHAMAAGLSIQKADFQRFKMIFESYLDKYLPPSALACYIESDGALSGTHFSVPFADLLRNATPWGQQFPAPLFDGYFDILAYKWMGEKHLKLNVRMNEDKTAPIVTALWFNADQYAYQPALNQTVHLAYRIDVNDFRGEQTVQLMIEYLHTLATPPNTPEPCVSLA